MTSSCTYGHCQRQAVNRTKLCEYHRELRRLKKQVSRSRNEPNKFKELTRQLEAHKNSMPPVVYSRPTTSSSAGNIMKETLTHEVAVIQEVKQIERTTNRDTEILRNIHEHADGTKTTSEVERRRDIIQEQILIQRRVEVARSIASIERILRNDIEPSVLIKESHNAKRLMQEIHSFTYEFDKEHKRLLPYNKNDPVVFKTIVEAMCLSAYAMPLIQFAWREILQVHDFPNEHDFMCLVTAKIVWAATYRRKHDEPNPHILVDPMDVIQQDDQDVVYIVRRMYNHKFTGQPHGVPFAEVDVMIKHLNFSRTVTLTEVDAYLLKTIKNAESDRAINCTMELLRIDYLSDRTAYM